MSSTPGQPEQLFVNCSGCNKRVRVPASLIGRKAKCPGCGQALMIPGAPPESTGNRGAKSTGQTTEKKATGGAPTTLIAAGIGTLILMVVGGVVIWTTTRSSQNVPGVASAKPSSDGHRRESDPPRNDPAVQQPSDSQESTASSQQPDAQESVFVNDEHAYEVRLTAKLASGQEFSWVGTTVVAKESDESVSAICGIAIPNRWIIVPLKAVESADRILVRLDGQEYEATIRRKIASLGYATLQIERSEKFPSPTCDRDNRFAWNTKNLKLIYLDPSGKTVIRDGFNVTAQQPPREYFVPKKDLPESIVGGIVVHDTGRIAGLVKRISGDNLGLMPWEQVGTGWGEKRGESIFDYKSNMGGESATASDRLAKHLVQVIVISPPKDEKSSTRDRMGFLFDSNVKADALEQPMPFADWQMPVQVQNTSQRNLELFQSPKDGVRLQSAFVRSSQRKQADVVGHLPFAVGPPARLTMEKISDPTADAWETERRYVLKLKGDCTIRPAGGSVGVGEKYFVRRDQYRVTNRRGDYMKLERTTQLVPATVKDRDRFEISGKETIELMLDTNLVRSRKYDGTFVQVDDSGNKHEATVQFAMNQLTPLQASKIATYWRSATP